MRSEFVDPYGVDMQYLQKSFSVSVSPKGDHPKKGDLEEIFEKKMKDKRKRDNEKNLTGD